MKSVGSTQLLIVLTVFSACMTPNVPLELRSDANHEAVLHNQEGMVFYQQGEWTSAKEHFEDAILADSILAEPHYNLALTLDKLGEHDDATKHFIEAGNLAPSNGAITQSSAYISHVERKRPMR